MGRVVADAKLVFDQLGHPALGPDLPQKAEGFGPIGEQVRRLGQLGGGKPELGGRERAGRAGPPARPG